ncbi:MAG: PepSY-associated TM helix domain-containing protein, partial [Comamonas sp.]
TLTLPGRIGNQLLGSMAILWLFLSISGLVLTLPARWSQFWSRWKPAWQVKAGSNGFRFVNDLHRAMGLWVLPLALCTAFTGVYLNLGNEVFKPVASLFGAISPHPIAGLPHLDTPRPAASVLTPEQALSAARQLLPAGTQDYAPWYMGHLAPRGAYRVAFKEPGMREQALRVRYEQVFIDDQTGELLGRFGYLSGTPTDRFLVWMYPLHSGKSLGLPGRLAIGLSGLCVALLCITGLLRWLKRRSMGH